MPTRLELVGCVRWGSFSRRDLWFVLYGVAHIQHMQSCGWLKVASEVEAMRHLLGWLNVIVFDFGSEDAQDQ